jgi:hypothetical protein
VKTQQQECDDECSEQPKMRVRSERRVGEYPEEAPGDGDRDRDRTRASSSEDSQTVDTSETVLPPDDDSGDTSQTVEPDATEPTGLFAQIAAFVTGIVGALGF